MLYPTAEAILPRLTTCTCVFLRQKMGYHNRGTTARPLGGASALSSQRFFKATHTTYGAVANKILSIGVSSRLALHNTPSSRIRKLKEFLLTLSDRCH